MRSLKLCLVLTTLMTLIACGEDEPAPKAWSVREAPGEDVAFEDDATSVIITAGRTQDGTLVVSGDPGQDCVLVETECISIEEAKGRYCDQDGAKADVIVDDGKVVDVICYPPQTLASPLRRSPRAPMA